MDTQNTASMTDLFDAAWLDDAPLEIPEMTAEDEAMVAKLMAASKADIETKAKLRALRRKKEDLAAGPSQKISIRIPRPILDLLKTQAALRGLPYQTYLNHLIYEGATR